MNFSSHIKRIRTELRVGLAGNKLQILGQLKDCLIESRALLKVDQFDFWIRQFELVDVADIALTKFGVSESSRLLRESPEQSPNTRDKLSHELENVAENLMTYSCVDDFCCLQSQYHWYYSASENRAYKESELGICEPLSDTLRSGIRIAKISEVNANVIELVD